VARGVKITFTNPWDVNRGQQLHDVVSQRTMAGYNEAMKNCKYLSIFRCIK